MYNFTHSISSDGRRSVGRAALRDVTLERRSHTAYDEKQLIDALGAGRRKKSFPPALFLIPRV
jgi:hypothetical protein